MGEGGSESESESERENERKRGRECAKKKRASKAKWGQLCVFPQLPAPWVQLTQDTEIASGCALTNCVCVCVYENENSSGIKKRSKELHFSALWPSVSFSVVGSPCFPT